MVSVLFTFHYFPDFKNIFSSARILLLRFLNVCAWGLFSPGKFQVFVSQFWLIFCSILYDFSVLSIKLNWKLSCGVNLG